MKKTLMASSIVALTLLFAMSAAFAQSSGNFAARILTPQCVVDNVDGTLGGGIGATVMETTIKTPNSGSTALVIRPSLVSGLYTKTKVTDTITTATAYAGLQVRVLIDGKIVAPGTPVGGDATTENGWVFYNKRWQQVTQNFLDDLAALDPLTTDELFLEFVLSTLSANSMDFVVGNIGGGIHTLKVEWRFEDSDQSGGNAAACVGPGVLTVEQVKTFSTGGGIVID